MPKVKSVLKKLNTFVNESIIERYSTKGGRYRIEVEKNGDFYNILYYSNGRQDGASVHLTFDEYKKTLSDTIESASRISKINYSKVA